MIHPDNTAKIGTGPALALRLRLALNQTLCGSGMLK